jgi:hypothetical protein
LPDIADWVIDTSQPPQTITSECLSAPERFGVNAATLQTAKTKLATD